MKKQTNDYDCPVCQDQKGWFVDYYDPGDSHGHGQVWVTCECTIESLIIYNAMTKAEKKLKVKREEAGIDQAVDKKATLEMVLQQLARIEAKTLVIEHGIHNGRQSQMEAWDVSRRFMKNLYQEVEKTKGSVMANRIIIPLTTAFLGLAIYLAVN